MIVRRFSLGLAAAAGALCLAAPASAQLSESGGPISYSADKLEYFDGQQRLVLTGDVDIVQNDARLRASEVTLYFANSGADTGLASGDIERMVAVGNVYYVRPDQQARGNQAVYETSSDTVTFTGNVIMASPDSVLRGERLVMQIEGGTSNLTPGAGQRVQGMFRPKNEGAGGAPTANN